MEQWDKSTISFASQYVNQWTDEYYIDSVVVTVVCTTYVVFQIEWHWLQHLQVTRECITTTHTVTIRGTQVGAVSK